MNLAPADVRKTGSHYDLAIALGYLLATHQIREFETRDKVFIGELALDGRLRPANGALNIAQMAARFGFKYLFLPAASANEAAAIHGIKIIPMERLSDAMQFLEGEREIAETQFKQQPSKTDGGGVGGAATSAIPDFSEIKGQENAKRALTIAAAGAHNVLLTGPPGVGKSMMAQALAGILPDLAHSEAIEITKIWSAAGLSPGGLMRSRPFRAPHQTASLVAIIGGGPNPRPGEISLAHRGILFLDELPEFRRDALEALRQPMESGWIHLSREKNTLVFPAKFTLIAAMNPCPCGYYGDAERTCKCTGYEVEKYQRKISGPLLDRIDLQIKVGRVNIMELRQKRGSPGDTATPNPTIATNPVTSPDIKSRVERARAAQQKRGRINAEMTSRQVEALSNLDASAEKFLETLDKSKLSPRGYYRLIKVARTIADLNGETSVKNTDLAEAYSYRLKDNER